MKGKEIDIHVPWHQPVEFQGHPSDRHTLSPCQQPLHLAEYSPTTVAVGRTPSILARAFQTNSTASLSPPAVSASRPVWLDILNLHQRMFHVQFVVLEDVLQSLYSRPPSGLPCPASGRIGRERERGREREGKSEGG